MIAELTTIAPVHISGGENVLYSPYMDYLTVEKHIVFIDSEKILKYLGNSRVVDEFTNKLLKSFDNNRSNYDISIFLKEKGIKIEDVEKYREEFEGSERNRKKEIRGFVSSAAGKYIPGSSIKGAIRTTLLYAYIKQRELKRDIFRKVVTLNKAKTAFEEATKEKQDIIKDALRGLMISDTEIIPNENFVISDIDILHLKKPERGRFGVLRWELLKQKTKVNFRLKLNGRVIALDSFWNFIKNKDYEALFKYINEFSLDFIEHEFEALDRFKKLKHVGELLDGYGKIRKYIEEKDNSIAVLPIGAGTSFFSKTVDMPFSEEEMENIRRRFRVVSLGFKKGRSTKPFPITRHICPLTKSNLIGWVQISLKQQRR